VPKSSIYSYENYDAIRDNKDIDAVYIALPNSMHAEYTIRAAKQASTCCAKKPMATSVADAKGYDRSLPRCEREADDRVSLPVGTINLHAIELIRNGPWQDSGDRERERFNIAQGEWRNKPQLAGGGPLIGRRRLLTQRLPLSHRRKSPATSRQTRRRSIMMDVSRMSKRTWHGP